MREEIKKKLLKILALAQRGVGGEKTNAEAILEREMNRHGLTIDDLVESVERKTRWFSYRSKVEKDLLFQCVFKVTNASKSISYSVNRRKRTQIGFDLTEIEFIELDMMYNHFRALYKKELKSLFIAFVNRHELYPETGTCSGSKLTEEEMKRIVSLMASLRKSGYVGPRKMLNA